MRDRVKVYTDPMPRCDIITPIVASGLVHDINNIMVVYIQSTRSRRIEGCVLLNLFVET